MVGKLRKKLTEKEHIVYGMQKRVVEAESTLQETSARLSHALNEQARIRLAVMPRYELRK